MAEPSKRLVQVAADLSSGGGVNKVIRDLAAVFSERLGCSVTVVNARASAAPSYPFPAGVTVENHPRGGILAYGRVLWKLRRSRPDVVIGPWTQDNILLTLMFLGSGSAVVLCEHSSWYFHGPVIRLLRRLIYRLASCVVVLNDRDLQHYSAYLDNVLLLPNPVTVPDAPSNDAREKLILAVGHLQANKNFADAICAMGLSGLERDGWSLAIIGDGPEEPKLRALIAQLGLTRTHIHPPTGDLARWYARASITLVTAKIEVFSLVLAEAMLAGVVPLAYAADGPAFILDAYPDLLVEPDDVAGLARRMAHLAAEPDLGPLRTALSESIRARFSPAVVAEQWRELLSGLMRDKQPGGGS